MQVIIITLARVVLADIFEPVVEIKDNSNEHLLLVENKNIKDSSDPFLVSQNNIFSSSSKKDDKKNNELENILQKNGNKPTESAKKDNSAEPEPFWTEVFIGDRKQSVFVKVKTVTIIESLNGEKLQPSTKTGVTSTIPQIETKNVLNTKNSQIDKVGETASKKGDKKNKDDKSKPVDNNAERKEGTINKTSNFPFIKIQLPSSSNKNVMGENVSLSAISYSSMDAVSSASMVFSSLSNELSSLSTSISQSVLSTEVASLKATESLASSIASSLSMALSSLSISASASGMSIDIKSISSIAPIKLGSGKASTFGTSSSQNADSKGKDSKSIINPFSNKDANGKKTSVDRQVDINNRTTGKQDDGSKKIPADKINSGKTSKKQDDNSNKKTDNDSSNRKVDNDSSNNKAYNDISNRKVDNDSSNRKVNNDSSKKKTDHSVNKDNINAKIDEKQGDKTNKTKVNAKDQGTTTVSNQNKDNKSDKDPKEQQVTFKTDATSFGDIFNVLKNMPNSSSNDSMLAIPS